MSQLRWIGPLPPVRFAASLRAQGIQIGRARNRPPDRDADGASAPVPVVFTRGAARAPKAPAEERWIWCVGGEVTDSARVEATLRGAYDVVDIRAADAVAVLHARLEELRQPPPPIPASDTVVTTSAISKQIIARVARVAPTAMPVLLTGETGTGKEIVARLIHAWSPRKARPLVPINCAAIPNELMEAELFGYARGAFSGAVQRYDGQLLAAAGGTVFLDEIDDTPPETQVKLLRVLEDRVVSRLGENVWHEVDFRLLAATNRDLRGLVDAGLFGADLYERLAIVTIQLVPLRDRLEDLPELARHFMERFAREHDRPAVTTLRADAGRALMAYPWPGNIRELRNVLYEALVYKRAGSELLLSDLPRRILKHEEASETTVDRSAVARRIDRGVMNLRDEVAALERVALDAALARTGGNAARAAQLLGAVGRGAARDPGGTVRAMMRRLK
jgi:DNA-binding NtrC family response regulator